MRKWSSLLLKVFDCDWENVQVWSWKCANVIMETCKYVRVTEKICKKDWESVQVWLRNDEWLTKCDWENVWEWLRKCVSVLVKASKCDWENV